MATRPRAYVPPKRLTDRQRYLRIALYTFAAVGSIVLAGLAVLYLIFGRIP